MSELKKTKNPSYVVVTLLGLIGIGNFFGLAYLYHLQEIQFLKVQQSEHTYQKLQKDFSNLLIENQALEMKLNQKVENPQQKLALYQLESLIEQAQWQINQMSDLSGALKSLKFAKRIATQHQWEALQESIQADLISMHQIPLTSPVLLIKTLSTLESLLTQSLKIQKSLVPVKKISTASTPWHQWIEPFVQIQRYQSSYEKIIAPTEKQVILLNALSLIPQIQFAGIHHQEKIYQQLIQEFTHLLSQIDVNDDTQKYLSKLQSYHFKIMQVVSLQSLMLIQQMIEHENKSS